MVNVWFCREGNNPSRGGPSYILSIDACIRQLDLSDAKLLCDLASRPRFGQPDDPLADIRGYQHVVLEIDEKEAKGQTTIREPGFYLLKLSPTEVVNRLGPPKSPWD